MKWINPLKNCFHCLAHLDLEKVLIKVWGGGGGGGCEKSHLNQKCRKFHEMDKSTKTLFSLFGSFGLRKSSHQSLRWWWGGGGCVKNHTWTKNAGNFMKWINPLKNCFHCLAHLDLENLLTKVWGGGGGMWKITPEPKYFMKWINPLKFFFSLFGSFGLRKFLIKVWGGGGGGGVWKITPEPKM